jgi:O-antigen ligase
VTAFTVESIIPLALTLFVVSRRTAQKWSLLVVAVLGLMALFGAHSRAAWIGLTVGLGTVACLLLRRRLIPKWQFMTLAYVGVLLLIISSPALVPKMISYMWARPETFYGRFESFAQGGALIADNVIAGVGLNNSTAVKLQYDRRDPGSIATQYLIVFSETGAVGLLLYLGFFGGTAVAALRLSRSKDMEIAPLAVAIFGIYVSLGVHTSADQLVKVATAMVWFYGGVVMALTRLQESGNRDPRPTEARAFEWRRS